MTLLEDVKSRVMKQNVKTNKTAVAQPTVFIYILYTTNYVTTLLEDVKSRVMK